MFSSSQKNTAVEMKHHFLCLIILSYILYLPLIYFYLKTSILCLM